LQTTAPLISVVMPVHNARPYLDESISSILGQALRHFEFVILDDASTDTSGAVLRDWSRRDARIRLYTSAAKLGLSGSSNFVVSKARGAIVARMDADDVSHPDRLARQWAVLEHAEDVAAVGTLCDGIDAAGRTVRPRDRWRLVRSSAYVPFPHGSAMFRRAAFDAVGGYRAAPIGGEDQDFFLRIAARGRLVTLPDVLYHYRYHVDNATIFNCERAITHTRGTNGDDLAVLYRLGAMRLWAGHRTMILGPLFAHRSLGLNVASAITLASATWGSFNPASLRFVLRSAIRARDLLASAVLKDGSPCEWRPDRSTRPDGAPGNPRALWQP
jgi:glycosyltransferase involved in cell wall biosynthesis